MLVAFVSFCLTVPAQGGGGDPGVVAGVPEVVSFKDGFEDFVGCGDGQLTETEACDDQNQSAGDGCDSSCNIETGFVCSGVPSVCTTQCGDGVIAGAEVCDDQNQNAGDGCDPSCSIEDGFSCVGQPSVCIPET